MSRNLKRTAAVSLAFACVAAGAFAMQPPNPNDSAAVIKWAEKNGVNSVTTSPQATWEAAGANEAAMAMAGILQAKDASNTAKVAMRMELFAPQDVGAPKAALALLERFDVNCANNTIRQVSTGVFAARNLGEHLADVPAEGAAAEPLTGHPAAAAATAACAGRTMIAAGPAAPARRAASVDATDERAVNNWLAANVQAQGWSRIGVNGAGVIYRSAINEQESTSRTRPRVSVRLEFFDPITVDNQPVLSQKYDYDIDCPTNRAKPVQRIDYPRHNLGGTSKITPVANVDFTAFNIPQPSADIVLIAATARDVCRSEVQMENRYITPG